MTALTQLMHLQINEMRLAGHAVVVFSEDELRPAGCSCDYKGFQDLLVAHGNDMLNNMAREEDMSRNAAELLQIYDPDDNGGEHPAHRRVDWRDAVAEAETIKGYWEWVWHSLRAG